MERFGLLHQVIAFVIDEGTNLTTMAIVLHSIIACEQMPWGKNTLGWTKKSTCRLLNNTFLHCILMVTKMWHHFILIFILKIITWALLKHPKFKVCEKLYINSTKIMSKRTSKSYFIKFFYKILIFLCHLENGLETFILNFPWHLWSEKTNKWHNQCKIWNLWVHMHTLCVLLHFRGSN